MATYTALLFSAARPNGLRIPFETQWQAIRCAQNAVANRSADFANAIRKDRLGRVVYVWHGDTNPVPTSAARYDGKPSDYRPNR